MFWSKSKQSLFIEIKLPLKIIVKISIVIYFVLANLSITVSQNDADSVDLGNKPNKVKYEMTKSPTGAIYRSLILPGWGQWYVESYWKAPIFLAGALGLYGSIIYNHIEFRNYADLLEGMEKSNPEYDITLLRREFFRDNRDMSGFYLIGVYVLATVDAYVGAHLFDFEVDESLSIGLIPDAMNPRLGVVIRF